MDEDLKRHVSICDLMVTDSPATIDEALRQSYLKDHDDDGLKTSLSFQRPPSSTHQTINRLNLPAMERINLMSVDKEQDKQLQLNL